MTAPADGIPRLMHFVDARLRQLSMSKAEANRRGFPHPSTLPAARDHQSQTTPTARTLLRIDRTLGWQPGSAAVILLGGEPLSVTARRTRNSLQREQSAQPMAAADVLDRLFGQLRDDVAAAHAAVRTADEGLQQLYTALDRLACEFDVDHALIEQFTDDSPTLADNELR